MSSSHTERTSVDPPPSLAKVRSLYQLSYDYSQNYRPLIVFDYITALNIQGYQDGSLMLRTTHTILAEF